MGKYFVISRINIPAADLLWRKAVGIVVQYEA
jgi:hypothetical protein